MENNKLLGFFRCCVSAWTWRMAWRDSRSSRRRLLFFSASIVLGIAALVAIASFGKNLQAAIEEHAKSLLGADLVIASRRPFSEEQETLLKSLNGAQSREINFSSMIMFPRTEGTRLVQVRALSGDFPYYGPLETEPQQAALDFRRGEGVLVEESLLIQFGAKIGDPVKIGELTTRIVGRLQKVPGETLVFATISPRVYMALSDLDKTGLVREGSLARYKIYFKFGPQENVERLVDQLKTRLNQLRLSYNTVEERKKDLGNAMENLYNFLNLVGFIALLLGGVGVASAINVHLKQKLDTVAVLRCLGCSIGQTFAVYLIQATALGFIGALAGAALGLSVQKILPRVVADFVPFSVTFFTSWSAVLQAMAIGFAICLLFALLPLLSVRHVSPLAAIRSSYEHSSRGRRDPLLWLAYGLVGAGLLAFSFAHTEGWRDALGFAGGLALAFVLLAGTAKLITLLARRVIPPTFPYVLRQGLANLHRPNNRTILLMLSLGLGTFLILTLYLTQGTLLSELTTSRQGNQPNAILFDIQADQKQGVEDLIRAQQLQVLEEAPVVTMRINSIKGRPTEELLADKKEKIPHWALRREYRSTYRDHLRSAERIVAGKWHPQAEKEASIIPISLEEGIAEDLKVGLGDEIVFDVQGVPIATRVASLRQVDWKRVQPNFFVVFPAGVLEDAPGFHVLVTRITSPEQSATLQRAVVQKYPNVSVIDITLVLQTLDSVVGKVSYVIRFMALFTVATGLLVLVGAVLTGRFQRVRESVLLRTLGASRAQVLRILMVEYLCLGAMAALTGIALALASSWALARFVFEVGFTVSPLPVAASVVIVSLLTVLTGLVMSRGVLSHPPLAVLRSEA
jgi:putative ABC transport system permease protein